MSRIEIRDARLEDAEGMLAIYAPSITDGHASFEAEVPSVEEFQARIRKTQAAHAWLVAEHADDEKAEVVGYAYGGTHRARHAYRFSVETAVYVADHMAGRGIAKQLYGALFARLVERGYYNAYAGITMPNPASVALHRSTGFEPIGTFRRVGFKKGEWRDVSWWHRPLRDGQPTET